jgi:hypothetical protein
MRVEHDQNDTDPRRRRLRRGLVDGENEDAEE